MAEMALGYGSEYQMLRYLGHHRMYLDSKIKETTKNSSAIEWWDYPVDLKRDSLDGEWQGVDFLEKHPEYYRICTEWQNFWPKRGQSWDGIFQQDGVIYVVEAKAHIKEMEQRCQAGIESREIIRSAFECVTHDKDKADLWLESKHYQLANRIAFVHFLNSMGVKTKLCYLFFLNGYSVNASKNVTSKKEFEMAFEEECTALHLNDAERSLIIRVYVDAKKDGFK